jgi:hypothetical protein
VTLLLALTLVLGADGGAAPGWEFEGLSARVTARAKTKDAVSAMALRKLGLQLEGPLSLKVSAKPNTVGGTTLHVEDPSDASVACDLYGSLAGGVFTFTDSRCSFPAFSGNLRTQATCRRISGSAKHGEKGLELEARFPDCNAAPMGLPLSLSGELSPR